MRLCRSSQGDTPTNVDGRAEDQVLNLDGGGFGCPKDGILPFFSIPEFSPWQATDDKCGSWGPRQEDSMKTLPLRSYGKVLDRGSKEGENAG